MGILDHLHIDSTENAPDHPIKNARRYVYHAGTKNLALLFADPDLTITTANPMLSDDMGNFSLCYLFPGAYDVDIRTNRGVEVSSVKDIKIVDQTAARVRTVFDLLQNTRFSYESISGKIQISTDDIITVAEGEFSYKVAAQEEVAFDLETTGGLKLFALPRGDGGVCPEQFGAVGDGTTDDTQALLAMTNFGRRHGSLVWHGRPGKIYTTTRARIFACIPYQKHFFNGAAIRNIRGSSAPDYGQNANYQGITFPSIFDQNGEGDDVGGYYYGETIAFAAVGSTDITVTGTMTDTGFTPGADVLIYGFTSAGTGFPPDPKVFEYARIRSVSGNIIHLETPLRSTYDDRWPDIGTGYGAARIISCNRPNFIGIRHLEVHDMWIKSNPNWTTAAATDGDGERNGRLTVAGYNHAEFYNLRTDGGFYLSQGGYFSGKGINNRTACEPDKVVERVEISDFKGGQLVGGTAIKAIVLNNPECGGLFNLAPSGSLTVNGGRITADALTNHMLDIPSGTSRIELNNVVFTASSATQRGIVSGSQKSGSFTVVSPTQLSMPTATFFSSQVSRMFASEQVLYKDGRPAFRLDGFPYQTGTTMIFDGKPLQSLSGSETLSVFSLTSVNVNKPVINGPYASQIGAFYNPNYQSAYEVADVVSPWEGPNFIEYHDEFILPGEGAILRHVGRPMVVDKIVVNVIVPYTGASGAATLMFRNYSDGSATLCTINLKQAGRRVIDVSGAYNLQTGDSAALGSAEVGIARIDRTASLAGSQEEQARWTLRIEGQRIR